MLWTSRGTDERWVYLVYHIEETWHIWWWYYVATDFDDDDAVVLMIEFNKCGRQRRQVLGRTVSMFCRRCFFCNNSNSSSSCKISNNINTCISLIKYSANPTIYQQLIITSLEPPAAKASAQDTTTTSSAMVRSTPANLTYSTFSSCREALQSPIHPTQPSTAAEAKVRCTPHPQFQAQWTQATCMIQVQELSAVAMLTPICTASRITCTASPCRQPASSTACRKELEEVEIHKRDPTPPTASLVGRCHSLWISTRIGTSWWTDARHRRLCLGRSGVVITQLAPRWGNPGSLEEWTTLRRSGSGESSWMKSIKLCAPWCLTLPR